MQTLSRKMKFETRESVNFESGGCKIFGTLHLPLNVENPPIVLMCHGFGGHKAGKYRVYVHESEMLSKSGIASFRFDFRGCGDSEGDWLDMTIGREVEDTIQALKFILTLPNVDHSRIGMLGKSMGGLVAVMAAKESGNIKSIALWAPAFYARQWETVLDILEDPATTDEMRKEIMKFDGMHANELFIREFAEIRLEDHLAHLHETPMLHIHGEVDQGVTIEHAHLYEKHRKGAQAKTQIVRLPNTGHDFGHNEEQEYTLEETRKWFLETL
ncbi:MAG: Esterase FrsA [Chlamydiae bacterium]|nr:Esterase FrsA [Chlamydiota bacterium]